jgi:hypothetical protein
MEDDRRFLQGRHQKRSGVTVGFKVLQVDFLFVGPPNSSRRT